MLRLIFDNATINAAERATNGALSASAGADLFILAIARSAWFGFDAEIRDLVDYDLNEEGKKHAD